MITVIRTLTATIPWVLTTALVIQVTPEMGHGALVNDNDNDSFE